MYC
jgi:hypothetical protein